MRSRVGLWAARSLSEASGAKRGASLLACSAQQTRDGIVTSNTDSNYRQSLVPPGDRADIFDTLRRFAAGQDFDDLQLFRSAFTPDAVLDFTGPARMLGAEITPFVGREAIASAVFAATAHLDTTHTITNERIVAYDGRTAVVIAFIAAQHLVRGDHRRHLLLKNRLDLVVRREEDEWRISEMIFNNMWREGEPSVLFPS